MLNPSNGSRVKLSDHEIHQYQKEGFICIKEFYDLKTEILPIQKDIYRIIGLIIEEHHLPFNRAPFSPQYFDSGLPELVTSYRKLAAILYDSVKKLPNYVRLANCKKNEELAKILLNTDFPGFANHGYGMRMDHPNEDKFLTQLHQDYVSQLCSRRGIVLWSPLRDVLFDMGPVMIYPGSHHEGIFPIIRDGDGSYGLKIKDEDKLVAQYPSIIPEVKAGDIIAMNYMTLHRSSPNRSRHTRWAMISRYFDFLEKTGISHGWKGGLAEGNSFEHVHPELSEIKKERGHEELFPTRD